MNVNKKKKSWLKFFGCDVRTVTARRFRGLPLVSGGGGKGNEAVFDTPRQQFHGTRA